MERLTTRSSGPLPVLVRGKAFGPAYFMSEHEYEDYRDALNKLAAYEDTGFEPGEIHNMSKELEDCKEWMSFSINDIKQKFFDFVRVMRQEAELDKKPKRRGRPPKKHCE